MLKWLSHPGVPCIYHSQALLTFQFYDLAAYFPMKEMRIPLQMECCYYCPLSVGSFPLFKSNPGVDVTCALEAIQMNTHPRRFFIVSIPLAVGTTCSHLCSYFKSCCDEYSSINVFCYTWAVIFKNIKHWHIVPQ